MALATMCRGLFARRECMGASGLGRYEWEGRSSTVRAVGGRLKPAAAAAQERTAARTGMDSKACRRCQEVKGAEEFYGSKQTVDGLQSYCKLCSAQTSQGRRSKETKEQREQQALTSPCVHRTPAPQLLLAPCPCP